MSLPDRSWYLYGSMYNILHFNYNVYTMPSRWEEFSNAAVEALGTGTPCVFSEIDPFLLPYRNVSLFHHINDSTDLTEQLIKLGENPNLRELVEREYTLEQVAKQYAELYRETICE